MTARFQTLAILTIAGLAACSDESSTPTPTTPVTVTNTPDTRGMFQKYVAIGTSISAGVQSDGLTAATQATSWPAQLDQMVGNNLPVPFIDGPGCRSPLVAPLASGVRLSGEPAGMDPADLSCAPLRADAALPGSNVAMNGALAKDALYTTAANITDRGNAKVYGRTLPSGQTQVSTMMALAPKIVSVELGANELLESRTGAAVPGVTTFPYEAWVPIYDAILDSVQKVTKTAVIVGLINDVSTFPAFRRGDELWANRAEFAAFNVAVSNDCEGSANLLFVPVRAAVAVGTGAAYAKQNAGPFTLSCAAGDPATRDYVLTPTEVAAVNGQMRAMTAHVQAEAAKRGFAYFALGALYDRADLKGPYSVVAQMTTNSPFGALVSLDGMHPSAAGQQVLARAAAQALNDKYHLGIAIPVSALATRR